MAIVKIDPEFEALIPKLSPNEFELLEENIRREGCRDFIRQWGDFIIDGHNRYQICQKWSIPFGTTPIELPDKEAALLWIEENQLGRRNLTDDQRSIISGRVANRKAELSRKVRAAEAGKGNGKAAKKAKANSGNNALPELTERVDVTTAKENKVPLRKVRAAQKLDKAAPELAAKVLNGEMSLATATREVKAREPEPEKVELRGLYSDPKDSISAKDRAAAGRLCAGARNMVCKDAALLSDPGRAQRIAQACKNREELDLLVRDLQRVKWDLDRCLPLIEAVLAATPSKEKAANNMARVRAMLAAHKQSAEESTEVVKVN